MSKELYLCEISGRLIKYEDILVTSHSPQLLASNCFLCEKKDSEVSFEFSNSKILKITEYFLFGEMFIVDEGEIKSGNGPAYDFFASLSKS